MPRPQQPSFEEALALASKLNGKYRPAWGAYSPEEQAALALYFLPHNSRKTVLDMTRPRVVKWYCPFAAQCDFPSGHRYCINVYTGCAHECAYCYATAYSPVQASPKPGFERLIIMDLDDLERFDVPAAPVHISNSTDPFQPLEEQHRHARFALEHVLLHRRRFTTVTILTKNPLRPVKLGYVDLFREMGALPCDHPKRGDFDRNHLPGFVVEVSLAFWREEARQQYDPCAPSVGERIEGLRALREAGIPFVLRIDPLFPRTPLTSGSARSFEDFGLVEPQTIDDLEHLVALAKELKVRHVVYSAAKIVQPKGRELSRAMQAMLEACVAPNGMAKRGKAWRFPQRIAQDLIVRPFLKICKRHGVRAKYCKQNLTETP